jgi:hypothetical protein
MMGEMRGDEKVPAEQKANKYGSTSRSKMLALLSSVATDRWALVDQIDCKIK